MALLGRGDGMALQPCSRCCRHLLQRRRGGSVAGELFGGAVG